MENNPKKSKAFIIAFILILLLLVCGYYLFKNRDTIFDAKGSTSLSKIFEPLFGTSKNKNLKVIDDETQPGSGSIVGNVNTDENGNKLVRTEAGEDIKRGDAVYISGFNKNGDPIIMKAIANDKNKSRVVGIAAEDIKKSGFGNIIVRGILSGINTSKTEGTPWSTNDQLYLSNTTPGALTKNPPIVPGSFIVPIGNVFNVDPINGSINISAIDDVLNSNGNKLVRAEAGEDIKKGDVVYISGFNKNGDPIVMKAIASDKDKSIVFGIAAEDIKKGNTGDIIVQGILLNTDTDRTEGTPWNINDQLYLSSIIPGAITKNPPTTPGSVVVPIGNVSTVDQTGGAINVSIIDYVIDSSGNDLVRVEAGEDIKKGDAVYISGFNTNGDPIVMRAIANDENKSIVFGIATEDIKKGTMGDIMIQGILSGINTSKTEGTLWGINDQLYLSSTIPGAITKNPPTSPGSFIVPIGNVFNVDPINGSINISIIKDSVNSSLEDMEKQILDYIKSIQQLISGQTPTINTGGDSDFPLISINLPGGNTNNNGGSVGGDVTSNYPYVKVIASSLSIKAGESSTISWTSTKTTSCNSGKGNGTGTSGSFSTGPLTKSMSYTVSCIGPGGSNAGSVIVMVGSTNGGVDGGGYFDFPSVKITAEPFSIKSGESSVLKWESTNATACKLSGGGLTSTSLSNKIGLNTGPIAKSISYSITCSGKNGSSAVDNVFVFVDDFSDISADFPKITISAEPSTIKEGETSLIKWESTNTTGCKLSGGGLTNTGISNTVGVKTGILKESIVFSITCTTKLYGTIGENVYVIVTPNLKFPAITVTANPTTVVSGKTSTIKWTSINTTTCNAGAGNGTGVIGSFVTPALTESKSYAVVCTGPNGSVPGVVSVKVTADDTLGTGGDGTGGNTTDPNGGTDTSNIVVPPVKGVCLETESLQFTKEEQKKLDELTRKFYLLAPTIRTEDDVILSSSEVVEQQNLLDHVKGLTKECYLQTNETVLYTNFCSKNPGYCNPTNDKFTSYLGNKTKYGNPWYQYTNRGTYIPGFENLELMLNIW